MSIASRLIIIFCAFSICPIYPCSAEVLEGPPPQKNQLIPPPRPEGGEEAIKAVRRAAEHQLRDSDTLSENRTRTDGEVVTRADEKKNAANLAARIETLNPKLSSSLPSSKDLGRPRVALVLGGGGMRGVAHIGILRELEKAKIPIDCIIGTSMGSLVGGLYSAGVPLSRIEEISVNGDLRDAYAKGSIPLKLVANKAKKIVHPFRKSYPGVWSGERLQRFVERQLPPGVENVQDTRIPFSAVATNLLDGKAYRLNDGSLATAIRASSSIAPLLQPVAIGDKLFCDGGIRANVPCSAAREVGADIVISVVVDEPLAKISPRRFKKLQSYAYRLTDVVLNTSDARQLQYADIVIVPDVRNIAILSRDLNDAKLALAAGEDAARKAIPTIEKKLQGASQLATIEDDKQLKQSE